MKSARSVLMVLVALAAITTAGCDDGPGETAPDPFDPNRLDLGELIVELDGIEYAPPKESIVTRYNEATRVFNITINDQDVQMTIELVNSGTQATHALGPGEGSSIVYRVGFGTQIPYSSLNEGGGGSVIVASFLSSSVQASFSGTLINSDDPNDNIVMTNGRFSLPL